MPKSQVDIANEVQDGLHKANEHGKGNNDPKTQAEPAESTEGKATRFDGSPRAEGDDETGTFKPKDDTPFTLEKKEGPRDDQ